MIFNSLTFLVFFALVLLMHNLPLRWTFKKANLLVASYLFYAAWNPPFVILIWISTTVDWFAAKWMGAAKTRQRRTFLLVMSLTTNLGLLAFFKYGTFLLENFVTLVNALGIHYSPLAPDIVLPVGISFYTFQTLSYTIDVYRGRLEPWESPLDFALFVTFFPQLVAGPIVRASDFLPQLVQPKPPSGRIFSWGLTLLAIGLFEKMVLADTILAPVSDMVYASPGQAGMMDAWLGSLAFAGQVFFDFSGYSTCAIGVGLCMGFTLPDNFRFPYCAVGFAELWRRWHITLSSWLRDYLYIPLGGSRRGSARVSFNLMMTMLLGGLWHGAGWTYIVWGGIQGLYLVVERFIKIIFGRPKWVQKESSRFFLGLFTFFMFGFTWPFFRARTLGESWQLFKAMTVGAEDTLYIGLANSINVAGIVFLMLMWHWFMRKRSLEDVARYLPWWVRSVVIAFVLFWLVNETGGGNAFIYFQF